MWVNTECTETHDRPRSATSCNLQSTLTLCEMPAYLCCRYKALCGDNAIWFDVCVYVCDDLYVQRRTYPDHYAVTMHICADLSNHECVCLCVCRECYRARGIMAPLNLCVWYCRTIQNKAQQLGAGLGWLAVG